MLPETDTQIDPGSSEEQHMFSAIFVHFHQLLCQKEPEHVYLSRGVNSPLYGIYEIKSSFRPPQKYLQKFNIGWKLPKVRS